LKQENGIHDKPNFIEILYMITIVSGLPRSGTSMMMNMLKAGGMSLLVDGIREPDKDNPSGYYEYEPVKNLKEGEVAWLSEASGKAVKVISYLLFNLPDNFQYRIVLMNRPLAEVLASQRKMLKNRGQASEKKDEKQLEVVFSKHLDQVRDWVSHNSYVNLIDVHYNHMIDDPKFGALLINRFLGNALDVEKMIQVVNPILYRQRIEDH